MGKLAVLFSFTSKRGGLSLGGAYEAHCLSHDEEQENGAGEFGAYLPDNGEKNQDCCHLYELLGNRDAHVF